MERHAPNPDAFNPIVWNIVRQVPRGQVTTFGQIASMIPAPDHVTAEEWLRLSPRWVGDAMNAVSFVDDPTIPWHRVINAKGGISLPEGSKSAVLQRARLEAEGITFNAKQLTSLDEFGWDGPDAAWRDEHGLLTPRVIRKQPRDTSGQLPLL